MVKEFVTSGIVQVRILVRTASTPMAAGHDQTGGAGSTEERTVIALGATPDFTISITTGCAE
jgi:hypothetical protein